MYLLLGIPNELLDQSLDDIKPHDIENGLTMAEEKVVMLSAIMEEMMHRTLECLIDHTRRGDQMLRTAKKLESISEWQE